MWDGQHPAELKEFNELDRQIQELQTEILTKQARFDYLRRISGH